MVRMPMRQPDIFRPKDALQLLLGYLVGLAPTPEVGLWSEPWIGDKDRASIVIQGENGITDGFESGLHVSCSGQVLDERAGRVSWLRPFSYPEPLRFLLPV